MNNNTKNSDSDIPAEVLELIPWYAIGNLSVDDQAFFEKALATYPSLQELYEYEQQIIQKVSVDHSILEKSALASPEERLKSVFNMIDIDEEQNQRKENKNDTYSIVEKLKNAFEFLVPSSLLAPKYARVASVGVLVLSVAVLTAFIAPLFTDNKSDFTPASATTQKNLQSTTVSASSKTVLLVGFNGTSIELGNNEILRDKLSSIKSVPDKEGIYQISFKQTLSTAEIKQTIDALLKQKQLIWFAGEAF